MKVTTLIQLTATTLLIACSGCSSIITGGSEKVKINSNPTEATVTVFNKKGDTVTTGTTPTTLKLKKKAGYFKGADYKLVIEKPGYKPYELALKHDINGWYFGNFGFGGLIGFLVVDPLTGGMWKLRPDEVDATLSQAGIAEVRDGEGLMVVLKEQLTPEQQSRLVPLQPAGSAN